MTNQTTISCPECGSQIDVNDILYHQVSEQIKKESQQLIQQEREKVNRQREQLSQQQQQLEQQQAQQAEAVEEQVKAQMKAKETLLRTKIKQQAAEEQQDAMKTLQDELAEKSSQVRELNKITAELAKLQREKQELAEKIRSETEQKLNATLNDERQRIQKEEAERNELKFKELQKQLDDQKKLTEEMKRKQEQGSMQSQGEVQELAIEEWLSAKFPLDVIQEIKKGERGGDCLQIVHTRTHQNCGRIYYESKRTKSFGAQWIDKFKVDIQEKNADIGVLVTEAMPADMDRMGLKEGVWVCTFEEFKGLCQVLRETIIRISMAVETQENRGDKMGMLYDYLTSVEFRLQIEAIVEGFTQMRSDLESEQRAMRSIWKKREKQIDKVLLNTTGMYGSIKGIAGSAVMSIPALELDDPDLLEDQS